MEAVYRDYAGKGVRFYFLYKSLAHPELDENYIQPFTLEERLAHARQAERQLGATIPWLVDDIDNRLKHAMGDRANSEFVVDPEGVIVRKRAWSDPEQLRKDLEQLVGKVEKITRPEELDLRPAAPLTTPAERGVVRRLARGGMFPIVAAPQIQPGQPPFYAKLRAEAEISVLDEGRGKLYLGFSLDPIHGAHWNNLTAPLQYELTPPEGVVVSPQSASAAPVEATTDGDPREFYVQVDSWPVELAIPLTVTYAACTKDDCHIVRQSYLLQRRRDEDAGMALVAGFRGMTEDALFELLLSSDRDADRRLAPRELNSMLRPRFKDHDANDDGALDEREMRAMARQLTAKIER